jgi:hypothetical protein
MQLRDDFATHVSELHNPIDRPYTAIVYGCKSGFVILMIYQLILQHAPYCSVPTSLP